MYNHTINIRVYNYLGVIDSSLSPTFNGFLNGVLNFSGTLSFDSVLGVYTKDILIDELLSYFINIDLGVASPSRYVCFTIDTNLNPSEQQAILNSVQKDNMILNSENGEISLFI